MSEELVAYKRGVEQRNVESYLVLVLIDKLPDRFTEGTASVMSSMRWRHGRPYLSLPRSC